MNAMDVLVQVLELGAELLGAAARQTKKARVRSADFGSDIRDQVTASTRTVGKKVETLLRTKSSTKARSLQFVAGIGVGVVVAMLLVPRSGKQMRDKLLNGIGSGTASDSNNDPATP